MRGQLDMGESSESLSSLREQWRKGRGEGGVRSVDSKGTFLRGAHIFALLLKGEAIARALQCDAFGGMIELVDPAASGQSV
ncbi:unnamed protein product [Calypogeia fissa]